ncbi:MAG: hypothetical protein KatS3mg129_1007 [Leptospiraceae bacterium]|nr:MAG: hypothetical protein KatS3mg129_1007 [Leptospiraceae bacterium]
MYKKNYKSWLFSFSLTLVLIVSLLFQFSFLYIYKINTFQNKFIVLIQNRETLQYQEIPEEICNADSILENQNQYFILKSYYPHNLFYQNYWIYGFIHKYHIIYFSHLKKRYFINRIVLYQTFINLPEIRGPPIV